MLTLAGASRGCILVWLSLSLPAPPKPRESKSRRPGLELTRPQHSSMWKTQGSPSGLGGHSHPFSLWMSCCGQARQGHPRSHSAGHGRPLFLSLHAGAPLGAAAAVLLALWTAHTRERSGDLPHCTCCPGFVKAWPLGPSWCWCDPSLQTRERGLFKTSSLPPPHPLPHQPRGVNTVPTGTPCCMCLSGRGGCSPTLLWVSQGGAPGAGGKDQGCRLSPALLI